MTNKEDVLLCEYCGYRHEPDKPGKPTFVCSTELNSGDWSLYRDDRHPDKTLYANNDGSIFELVSENDAGSFLNEMPEILSEEEMNA